MIVALIAMVVVAALPSLTARARYHFCQMAHLSIDLTDRWRDGRCYETTSPVSPPWF
jgi:hypothetical protein